jgi:hypothetical protein
MYKIYSFIGDFYIGSQIFTNEKINLVEIEVVESDHISLFTHVYNGNLKIEKDSVVEQNPESLISRFIDLKTGLSSNNSVLNNQFDFFVHENSTFFETVYFSGSTLTVSETDKNKIYNVTTDSNYNVILPKLEDVGYNDVFSFKNFNNTNYTGYFQAFSNEKIESSSNFEFHGIGSISMKKEHFSGGSYWSIFKSSNLKTHLYEGRSKLHTFTNQSEVTINHNFGYTPMVQVWVEDGLGGYTDVSVDVDHDFENKNTFTVNFFNGENGIILYI